MANGRFGSRFIPFRGTGQPAPTLMQAAMTGLGEGVQSALGSLMGEMASDLSRRRKYKRRISGFKKAGFSNEEAEALATLSETDPNLAGNMAFEAIKQRQQARVSPSQTREYLGLGRPEITPGPQMQAVPQPEQQAPQMGPTLGSQQPIAQTLMEGLQQRMAPQQQQWPGAGDQAGGAPQKLPFVPAPPSPSPRAPMVAPAGGAPGMEAPGTEIPEEAGPFGQRGRPTTPFGALPGFTPTQLTGFGNLIERGKGRLSREDIAREGRKLRREEMEERRARGKLAAEWRKLKTEVVGTKKEKKEKERAILRKLPESRRRLVDKLIKRKREYLVEFALDLSKEVPLEIKEYFMERAAREFKDPETGQVDRDKAMVKAIKMAEKYGYKV